MEHNEFWMSLECPYCVLNQRCRKIRYMHCMGHWRQLKRLLTESKVASWRVWATWRLWSSCCQCSYRNTWGSKTSCYLHTRSLCKCDDASLSRAHLCWLYQRPTKQTFFYIKVLSQSSKGTEQLVQWSSITKKGDFVVLWLCGLLVGVWATMGDREWGLYAWQHPTGVSEPVSTYIIISLLSTPKILRLLITSFLNDISKDIKAGGKLKCIFA